MNDTQKFYDELSGDYHLIFADWNKAIQRQTTTLDGLIQKYSQNKSDTLLDCSCGIGTQCIGLAEKGYKVTASDLSPQAVQKARGEAESRGLNINFGVADFMYLDTQIDGIFDVVISCDNSLPHILQSSDLLIVAQNIYKKLGDSGMFLGSIRDYDTLIQEKPVSTLPTIKSQGSISFQTWDWEDSNIYTVNHFTLKKDEDYKTHHRSTKYRAYQRDEMKEIFEKAGFQNIQWLMPKESGYYQPIIIAYK